MITLIDDKIEHSFMIKHTHTRAHTQQTWNIKELPQPDKRHL